ncbi:hypothetical protein PMAYCL1PPCAC_11572, partial [Pristionchus mayeri]
CDRTSALHSTMDKLSFQEKYEKDPISTLPDEVWMKIFGNLTSTHRFPLGTTCKRFRELDLEVGGTEYSRIAVKWLSRDELGVLAYAKHAEYKIFSADPAKFSTYRMRRLFRKAKAHWLEIKNLRDQSNDELEVISTLLKTTTYKKLNLHFKDIQHGLDVCSFITSLLKDRNLERSQIRLSLNSRCSATEFTRMRAVLKNLPKVDKFNMEWTARNPSMRRVLPEECVMDDETLLHIITHTNHAELEKGNCSAQGILRAFEICNDSCISVLIINELQTFRLSQTSAKFVSFYVPKPAIDGLFSDPNLEFKKLEEENVDGSTFVKEIFDTTTRSSMEVEECHSFYRVEMYKYDNDGQDIRNTINWTSGAL